MTVDIVLDLFQTIKYFSNIMDKQRKCKDTKNIIKGVLTVIFVVAFNPIAFQFCLDW